MKKYCFILFFSIFLLPLNFLFAEEYRDYLPEGMEIIKVNKANVLVPIGTKIRKAGDLIVIEDISEYSSRRFVQIEARFQTMETKLDNLASEIKENFKQLQAKQKELENRYTD